MTEKTKPEKPTTEMRTARDILQSLDFWAEAIGPNSVNQLKPLESGRDMTLDLRIDLREVRALLSGLLISHPPESK